MYICIIPHSYLAVLIVVFLQSALYNALPPFMSVPAERSQRGEIFSIQFSVHHEQPSVDSICGVVGRAFAQGEPTLG